MTPRNFDNDFHHWQAHTLFSITAHGCPGKAVASTEGQAESGRTTSALTWPNARNYAESVQRKWCLFLRRNAREQTQELWMLSNLTGSKRRDVAVEIVHHAREKKTAEFVNSVSIEKLGIRFAN